MSSDDLGCVQVVYERGLGPVQAYMRLLGTKLLISFNQAGNKAVLVHKRICSKNKGHRFFRSSLKFYEQKIEVVEIQSRPKEIARLRKTFEETELLKTYYSHKEVQGVDYLSGQQICLIFDDELLCVGVDGGEIEALNRIMVHWSSPGRLFWGVYNDAYVFGQSFKKLDDIANLGNAQYLERASILEIVRERKEHYFELETSEMELNKENEFYGDSENLFGLSKRRDQGN